MGIIKKFWERNKLILLFLVLCFAIFVLFVPNLTTPGKYDRRCWITWSNYIDGNGIGNIYILKSDYLPLYQFMLYLYAKVQGSLEGIVQNVNSLKYLTFFFELLSIFYVYQLTRFKFEKDIFGVLILLVLLLNPSFLYNTALYGQVDGMLAAFSFISVFYGIKKKPALSLIFFVLAVNLKLQAIAFGPLIFFLILDQFLEDFSFRKSFAFLLPSLLLQFVILLPFIFAGQLGGVWWAVVTSEGRYPFVSMGAFNWWYFIFDNPKEIMDSVGFYGRSYKRIGQVVYLISVLFACLPFIKFYYNKYILKKIAMFPSLSTVMLVGLLMALTFFYFNTEMHARYIHVAIIFGGAYAILERSYLIYILLSLANFLNIEDAAKILKGDINNYEYFFFEPQFVVSIFLVVLVLSYYTIFKKEKIENI